MAKSYTNWEFSSENVQSEVTNGEYVSAESTLVLGGPSRLSMLAAGSDAVAAQTSMFPIGLIEQINVTQSKTIQRIFEIGSKRAYFVPGRMMGQLSINRVLFFGPSLMRMLYAVAPYNDLRYGTPFRVEGGAEAQPTPEYANVFGTSAAKRRLTSAPGYGGLPGEENRDFFINLASDLFNIPFGMCILLKDPKNNPYGAMYLEDVMIENHAIGVQSTNIVMAESINATFGQVAPVQLVTRR